jgi:hypothetical protein
MMPPFYSDAAHDPALRLRAERVLERHQPHTTPHARSSCAYCAEVWPCPSALSAQQAAGLAGAPIELSGDPVAPEAGARRGE